MPDEPSPAKGIRFSFAAAAIICGALGLIFGSPRVLAMGGAFGIMWTAWDLMMAYVVGPAWDLMMDMLQGGGGPRSGLNVRPTLDETITYLQHHIARDTTEEVDVQAALRLEEIFRLVKKDHAKARAVLVKMMERYPGERRLMERMREYEEE